MKKIILMLITLQAFWSFGGERVFLDTQRKAPNLIINPDQTGLLGSDQKLAEAWLEKNWQRLRLESKARNLVLVENKTSQAGVHYTFGQMLHGIPVENAFVVVSINKETGEIYRVANTTWSIDATSIVVPKFLLNQDDAMDVTWNHLKVTGELAAMPAGEMVWLVQDGKPSPIWRVDMGVSAPHGSWSVAVDAFDGTVISAENHIRYHNGGSAGSYDSKIPSGDIAISDRKAAENRYLERKARVEASMKLGNKRRVDGMGTVFDPDPRTALMAEEMDDDVDDATIESTYVTRILRDITLNGENYELTGPWVQVRSIPGSDYEPGVAPVTTTDGIFDFRRGNNGFNDTMTYFHIDQNQRYIQALGFTGQTGLQDGSIQVDTHGLINWIDDDNSFFDPSRNALAFGHGCVDDNEDADVILHEYGHALQDWIDGRWSGTANDAGGMGEGFADYWGGTYSLKTPNGRDFHPEWIYTWDGHNRCWGGRRLDATYGQYNPNRSYNYHSFVDGIISDELWSTPLFQSMYRLFQMGIPIAESDRLVLESHYGAGTLTMALMAENTMAAANALYPDGPHPKIFTESFARQSMTEHISEWNYVAAHVPPGGGDTAWRNEIELTNVGNSTATITATVYESESAGLGLGIFEPSAPQTLTLEAGDSSKFEPTGTGQRWVRFTSDQPLAGVSFFRRNPRTKTKTYNPSPVNDPAGRIEMGDVGERRFGELGELRTKMDPGQERAGIPLFSDQEISRRIVFPHVPADRARFWSGAVVLNSGTITANLSVQLIGENGSDLSHLLSPTVPAQLEPFQKWVTFLAPGPGGAAGIFDDAGSEEKVSYVVMSADQEIAGFQLFGYQLGVTDEVATSGIMALPDQNRTHWPIRVALTDVEWSGFTVLNPGDSAADLDVTVLGTDGNILAEARTTIQPREKLLGLNSAGGFNFPSNADALISLPDGTLIQTVLITNKDQMRTFGVDQPLRIFDLAGNFAGSELDGGAVMGLATHQVFSDPQGTLELFKAEFDGDLELEFVSSDGTDKQTVSLVAGASSQIPIPENTDSIVIRGEFFTASVIDRDSEDRALTIINGKQADWTADGETP